jgi:hypothetical protein
LHGASVLVISAAAIRGSLNRLARRGLAKPDAGY